MYPMLSKVQNDSFVFHCFSSLSQSAVLLVLLHQDTTAELGLSRHVGVCVRGHPPHDWLGVDGIGCGQDGLLWLEPSVERGVWLLADVESCLEKVRSRGHWGHSGAGVQRELPGLGLALKDSRGIIQRGGGKDV